MARDEKERILAKRAYWRELAPLSGETELIETRREDGQIWVRPQENIFYPESGGQLADRGRLGERELLDVQLREEEVWLRLDGEPGAGLLAAEVDGAHRRDHSAQHSGQHLLSAVCLDLLAAPTLSFHMGEESSTVELGIAELDDADLLRVELAVAERIRENRPIRALYPTLEEAARLPLRKAIQVEEDLRVIEIEGLDHSPCGGTHLSGTGELMVLWLGRRERIRGRWRVEFMAGERALAAAREALRDRRELADRLSCAGAELGERVGALQSELSRLRKSERRLVTLEAGVEAASLADDSGWEPHDGGWSLLVRNFGERAPADLDELAGALCAENSRILIAACREGGQGRLVFQRSRGEGPDLGGLFRMIGVRGGGGPDRARGACEVERVEEFLAAAREILRGGDGG
jgi:alanyl-tRNA synthetase